jgi:protein pelota
LKIFEKNLKKGSIKLMPENVDDLWHLYNIIYEGDIVYAHTTRLVKPKEEARPKKGERIPVFLGINVIKVEWDKTLSRLRIHGAVCEAPEDVIGLGAHHTINVTINMTLTIIKEEWAFHHLERLERASKKGITPILVVAIDDEEYCIAVLQQYGVDVKAEEKVRLPSKLESDKRTMATKEFFNKALKALKEIWTNLHYPIIIIGVGFVKNAFVSYLKENSSDVARAIADVKSVNTGGIAGIYEALRSGIFMKTFKNIRVAEENKVVEEVLARIGKGKNDVAYGFEEVKEACNYGAIEKIIISDKILRESSNTERRNIEQLINDVEQHKGEVMVISAEHEGGKKLLSLGGIAALLRFSIQ